MLSRLHFVIGHQNGFDQRKYCSTSLYIVHPVGEYICWGSWPVVQILKLLLYNTRSNPVLNTYILSTPVYQAIKL